MSRADVLAAALAAHDAGMSVVRVKADGSKAPMGRWKQYQQQPADRTTVERWFAAGHGGLGVVCGAVSGGLEMLEFEGRAVAEGVVDAFLRAAEERDRGLFQLVKALFNGYSERTPSGGIHLLYRCDTIDGNLKLARRPATEDELADDPDDRVKVLIETRGEGGFVVVAPSNGTTHPSGRAWELIEGGFATIPKITPASRQALLDLARTFDVPTTPSQAPSAASSANGATTTAAPASGPLGAFWQEVADTPQDWFNRNHTCPDVLLGAGFAERPAKFQTDANAVHFTRPGKGTEAGNSATVWRDNGRCSLWSTSIDAPAEAIGDRNLSAWQLHVFLNHGGNWSRAASEARRQMNRERQTKSEHVVISAPPEGVDPDTGEVVQVHDSASSSAGSSTRGHSTPELPPVLPDEFWSAREVLERIQQAARSRLGPPDATLGVVLARVAALTDHTVKLPPIVGGAVGLTFYAAPIAGPGIGKSTAIAVGRELVSGRDDVREVPTGSGEGLVEEFFDVVVEDDVGKVKRQVRHGLLVTIGEGTQLLEVGARQGSTTLSVLREAYTDGVIGNANADAGRRRVLPAGQYVYGLAIGFQPRRVGPLLADAAAGTPQRFVWVSANDPGAPEVVPDWPDGTLWTPIDRGALADRRSTVGGFVRHLLGVDPSIVTEVRNQRRAVMRGELVLDALDAHNMLVRLKTAALLAVLERRLDVTVEDWQLAGVVVDTSAQVRAFCQELLGEEQAQRERAQVARHIRQEAASEHAAQDRALASAARSVGRKVHALGRANRRDLTLSIAGKHRQAGVTVEHAIARAVADGVIRSDGDHWVPARREA